MNMNEVDFTMSGEITEVLLNTYHLQDGGVTSDNEGQAAETFNTVSDAHRQFFMEVSCAAL